jgi:hypothetical protein
MRASCVVEGRVREERDIRASRITRRGRESEGRKARRDTKYESSDYINVRS